MLPDNPNNSWESWSKHVLAELKRLSECYGRMDSKIDKLAVDMAMLKVKSGVWGAIAGIIPAALVIIYLLLKQ